MSIAASSPASAASSLRSVRSAPIKPNSPRSTAPGSEERDTRIVADVTATLRRGRNCLMLTRRVAHVEHLVSALASQGHQPLVLQGGLSASDRRPTVNRIGEAKTGDGVLVIGTTPFIGEGLRRPRSRHLDAGLDEVDVQQIGADQDAFLAASELEVVPTFS